MSLIRLTDDELTAVLRAAQPIAIDRRDKFLQQVADELARCGEIGPGVVHRICAAVQRAHFDPPIVENRGRARLNGDR
jgi:hypothetical protein